MTNCPLELNADGRWQCPQCEWTYNRKSDKPPHRNCTNSPDVTEAAEKLGITGKDIKHWAQALAKWTRAGFPVRSQQEMDRCMRICVRCGDFIPSKPKCTGEACRIKLGGRCKRCGCRVSKSSVAVANKIRMATEECDKWKPLSDIEPSRSA